MSARGGPTPTARCLDMVKNGVERCLQNYMNKTETIDALLIQYKIDPWFTELVWGRLENENPEFFKAYYAKLLVKNQIMQFNRLLSEQVERMHQSTLTRTTPGLTSNESRILSTQQIPTPISVQSTRPPRAEDMQQLNVFRNNGSSIPPWQLSDWNIHARENEVCPDMFLPQNQIVELAQTMNGQTVRPEYAGRPLFDFSPPTNFPESQPPLIADASMPRFSSVVEPNPQDLHSMLFDLERFQQAVSPELPLADFTGFLGDYGRLPFQPRDANNFMDPHLR